MFVVREHYYHEEQATNSLCRLPKIVTRGATDKLHIKVPYFLLGTATNARSRDIMLVYQS